jgi:pyruvate formate lyase activating enzyme
VIKGVINKILPFSSVDGPGNRTGIFMQGCNFNCAYCHNPETIEIGHSKLTLSMTVEEVIKEIVKTKAFISGITVSGGECTLQHEFLTALFREVKKMDLSTFVDTNGSVPFYELPELVEVMDMAMVDVKAFDSEEHKNLTSRDNDNVLKNVRYLAEINKLYEVRTVIVPGILDNYKTVDMTSKLIASLNPEIRYKLIKYRAMGVRTSMIKSYTPGEKMMKELMDLAEGNGCRNVILV